MTLKNLLKKLEIRRKAKAKKAEAIIKVKILHDKKEWLVEKDGKIEHIRR